MLGADGFWFVDRGQVNFFIPGQQFFLKYLKCSQLACIKMESCDFYGVLDKFFHSE